MKKFKWILPVVASVVIVGLLVFVAVDGGTPGQTIRCEDCNGVGQVIGTCDECGSPRTLTVDADGKTIVLSTHGAAAETPCEECESMAGISACESCEGAGVVEPSHYYATWVALLAPIIAITLALITKEVYSSLMIGIVVGGLFAFNFNPVKAIDGVIQNGIISAVSDTAGIFAFLVILGILVALVNKAGGAAAFGRWAQKNIKSRTGAQLAAFVLGVLIFIDDYFNCLTVGSVMRPVTDAQKISRAKLAFIIDATAAPICMIAPISSWAAAVAANAKDYSADVSGIQLFIQAIPYNLYSLLTLAFVVIIILMKFDYGPMKLHEMNALKGDLMTSGEAKKIEKEEFNPKGKTIDLILPVIVLVAVCAVALVYVGGFFSGEAAFDLIAAFEETDATVALPLGGFVALVFTILYLILRRIISFKDAMSAIPKGFIAMVPAILILTMATSLKNMTGLLGADVFVGQLMEGSAAGLANFLPAIIFLVAVGLSFSTGTSWGTFGILIPIVLQIPYDVPELKIIAVSACLAGSVCGDHCSPISDTTIMSSAGAQCDHVNHVSTQMPYALTVAAVSFVGYILAGFVQNVFVVLGVSLLLMIAVLFVLKMLNKKST